MFDHKEMFEALQAKAAVKVQYKNESRLMRTVGVLKPGFMNLVTTVGETVYFPSRDSVELDYSAAWETLCRELVHVEDYHNYRPGWLSTVLYMFPPWRHQAKMRGYAMDMALWYWTKGSGIPQGLKARIVSRLSGQFRNKNSITAEVNRWSKKVLCGEMDAEGKTYQMVREMIEARIKRNS